MKTLALILVTFACGAVPAWGAVRPLYSDAIPTRGPEAGTTGIRAAIGFADEEGDGIPNAAPRGMSGIEEDRFIDEDGDGICDTRSMFGRLRLGRGTMRMMPRSDQPIPHEMPPEEEDPTHVGPHGHHQEGKSK